MLTEERRSRIQAILARQNTVTIAGLAQAFGTSEMTIRRDLGELEARGLCQRIHGGALALRVTEYRNPAYPAYVQRERCQVREKVAIARAAAGLVNLGDVVAIDTGTTAAYLARALRTCEPITVITNSLRVLDELQDVPQITLICPGGTLSLEDRNTSGGDLAFVGPIAVSTLRSFRPKTAFIGTSGLTIVDGISNEGLFQAEIKRVLIEIADQAVLITDHSKFGHVHGTLVAALRAFQKVITDTLAPERDVAALRAQGIEVIQVEPAEEAAALRTTLSEVLAGPEPTGGDAGVPPAAWSRAAS